MHTYDRLCRWLAGWKQIRPSNRVTCPQCVGEDDDCLYCSGYGAVTVAHAQEWHRQNDPDARFAVQGH